MKSDIIIVGAGASGLMSAIAAARQFLKEGKSACRKPEILILERMEKPGKKILATGNGRCNYTNRVMDTSCYHSAEPRLIGQVLGRFGYEAALDFFSDLGIYPKDRDGYIYPASNQAAAVLDVLLMEIRRLGVKLLTGKNVEKIRKIKDGFEVVTSGQERYTAKKVILAGGGRAYPKLGSDGSCYDLARQLGLSMTRVVPALTGLYAREKFFKSVSGVRADGCIHIYACGQTAPVQLAMNRGEVQLTDYGVSGIPAFQVSRYVSKAIDQKKKVSGSLDFMPDMDKSRLFLFLTERAHVRPDKTADEFLIGMFHQKLCRLFNQLAGLNGSQTVGQLNKKQLGALAEVIKNLTFQIERTGGFDNAQVCAGGVDGRLLSEYLEVRKIPGLYIAGELVDVDGICGGYNLQWAWSSGYVAGTHAGKELV